MPRWTTEARLKQAERIRALCPWKKATGPRTEEGKARSAQNAWKGGGIRATLAHYSQILREVEASTRKLFSSFGRKRVSRPQRTWAPKPPCPEVPMLGPDPGFPPDSELDGLSQEELLALAGQLLGGGDLLGGGLFSSFC